MHQLTVDEWDAVSTPEMALLHEHWSPWWADPSGETLYVKRLRSCWEGLPENHRWAALVEEIGHRNRLDEIVGPFAWRPSHTTGVALAKEVTRLLAWAYDATYATHCSERLIRDPFAFGVPRSYGLAGAAVGLGGGGVGCGGNGGGGC